MASRVAELILTLKDMASTPLSTFGTALGKVRAGWIAVAGATAGAVKFLKDGLKALAEDEAAISKLNIALNNQGTATEGAAQRLADYADRLQDITRFSNTAIIESQNLLATFGMNEAAIKTLTPRILDMAEATGVDLRAATIGLGKAIQTGSSDALKRYGIVVDDSIFKSKNLNKITETLDNKFKGTAETIGKTYSGRVAQLSNSYEDLKKTTASYLAGPATYLMKNMTESIIIIATRFIPWLGELIKQFRNFTLETLESIATLGKWIPGVGDASLALAEYRQKIAEAEVAMKQKTAAMEENRLKAIEQKPILISTAQEIAEAEKTAAKESTEAAKNTRDEQMKAAKETATAIKTEYEFIGSTVGSNFADMIVSGKNFETSMKDIGNSIAKHFIDVIISKMVANWIAGIASMVSSSQGLSIPGTGTPAAIPTGGGKILANVGGVAAGVGLGSTLGGNIAGKQTNKGGAKVGSAVGSLIGLAVGGPLGAVIGGALGGVVGGATKKIGKQIKKKFSGGVINEPTMMFGLNSGSVGMAGEAGVPEAIISFPEMGLSPMEGRRRLAGGGGGGGNTIIIQAGTIVADRISIKEFAERIDEELFRLHRNRKSVAF